MSEKNDRQNEQQNQEHLPDERHQEHEQEPRLRPRIYVASLSDYNAGRLHGAWLDAAQAPEALLADISTMLAASPIPEAEEWAIHDYEAFAGVRLGEYESIDNVSKIALGIAEHGAAYGAWAEYLGRSDWEDLERFEDCYQGRWESLTDYAEDFLEALGLPQIIEQAVPEELQPYVQIDAEAFGRDMSYNGDVYVVEDDPAGGIFIFGP
jgi:antirestriction protein